jgi:hypothetical protein
MSAFSYPADPHVRRHGPTGYAVYESYRPWLRDEFTFRCVFCLLREQWGHLRGTFDIDHFLPVSSHPEYERVYDNLLYCCVTCNAAKGKQIVADPSLVLLAADVQVHEDGTIEGRTAAARRLIRVLGLDDAEYTEFRLLWLGIAALAERHDPQLHRQLMGFPDELPDLARLRPPTGNMRPEGIEASYFARRARGVLPEEY